MESKIIFGKMVDYYRKKNKLTMEELGEKLGKTKSTISRWVSGERYPKIEEVEQIANFFGTDVKTLIFGGNNIDTNDEIISIYNQLEPSRKLNVLNYADNQLIEQRDNIVYLEAYQDVQVISTVSAGTGILDLDPFTSETVEVYGKIPENFDLAFKVSGDSMEPIFKDGEIIYVKRTDEINNGQIAVVQINEESFLKKVYVEDNDVKLVSLNNQYKDIIATEKDSIRFVGKVLL